jgi:protein-S-isoprenylcysteine O-methyltransferase Ste14
MNGRTLALASQAVTPNANIQPRCKGPGDDASSAVSGDRIAPLMLLWFTRYALDTLWLTWLIYWCAAAFKAKATTRSESMTSRLLHFVPLGVAIVLLVWPAARGSWLALRFLPYTLSGFFLGFILAMAGLCLSVLARVWLGGNWSGTVTLKQDHELIRAGPYRWVRHPIYTGLLLGLLGSAIATGQWRGLLALALIAIAFLRKISTEERFLTEQFGATYTRYQAEVAALVPGIY